MHPFPLLLTLLAAALAAPPAYAADRTWDGGGDGQTWSVAANWSDDAVPGAADHAIIGGAAVVLTADAAVGRLSLGAGATLTATGFRLALGAGPHDVAPGAVLAVGHPTGFHALTFDGPLAVRGRMDWAGGVVRAETYGQPPGVKVLTVEPGGTMRWLGAAQREIQAAVVNNGTIRWEAGLTTYYQGYSFSSSGLFEIALAADAELRGVGVNNVGPWFIPNTGTVRKSGAGRALFAQIELRTLGGSVDVQEGSLVLDYTSRWENATVAVAAGATLQLAGNRSFNAHTVAGTLSGAVEGTMRLSGLPGQFHSTMVAGAAGGTLNLTGTGLQVDNAQLGYREGSTFYSAPTNAGLLRFVGVTDHLVDGPFRNDGTLRWEDGRLLVSFTTLTNAGLFELAPATDRELLQANSVLRNTGTLRKTGGASAVVWTHFEAVGGRVEVQGGQLVFGSRGRWEDAAVAVATGATLRLDSNRESEPQTIVGTLAGDIAGTFVAGGPLSYHTTLFADPARGGRLELSGTGLQLTNAYLGANLGGGVTQAGPTNGGLLRLVGPADHWVGGPFRNEGTLRWEDGRFLVQNATLANAGLFEIALATNLDFSIYTNGTVVNTGTVRKTGAGTTTSYANFRTVGGTVDVREGTLVQEAGSRWENAAVAVAAGATLRLGSSSHAAPHVVAGTLTGSPAGTFIASGNFPYVVADASGGVLELGGTGFQVGYAQLGANEVTPNLLVPTNRGLLRFVGGADHFVRGAFRNEGTLRWQDGRLLVYNATLANVGTFEIALAANLDFSIYSNGAVVNTGTVRQVGAGTPTSYAAFTNRGRLVVAAGTLVMAGTFTNASEGSVAGTGTLDVRPLNNDPARVQNFGVVAPGPSDTGAGVGTLTWLGAFRMDQQARLLVEVGPGPTGDRLAVSGTAALASQLVTRVVGGYAPAPGHAFDVLTATGGVTGTFATVSTVVGGGNVVFQPDYSQAGRVTLRAVEGQPVPPFVVTPSPIVAGGLRTVALLGEGFGPGAAAALVCAGCADPDGPNARIEGEVLATAEDRIDVRFDLTDDLAIGDYDLVLRAGNDSTRATVWVAPYVALPLLTPVGPQALAVRPAPAANLVFENLYNITNAAEPTLFLVEVEPPPGPVRFDPLGVQLAPGETEVPRQFLVRVPATSEHAQTLTFAAGVDPADVRFPGQPPLPDDPRVPFEAPQNVQFRVAGGVSPHQYAEYLAEIAIEAAAEVGVVIPPDSALIGATAVVDELLYGDGRFDTQDKAGPSEAMVVPAIAIYSLFIGGGLTYIWFNLPEPASDGINQRIQDETRRPTRPCNTMTPEERNARDKELTRQINANLDSPNYDGLLSIRLNRERNALRAQRRSAADPCNRDEPVIPQRPRAPVDPNDKLAEDFRGCEILGVGEEARCGRYLIPLAERDSALTYTIKFENLPAATAPAEFVTITDVLDANLDPSTFEFLGSTADSLLTIEQSGQTLTFRFTGIDLPPNVTAPEGEGAVTFRVRPRPGLADGTEIRNDASIVFDFNPPIETPEVVHVVRATADLALAVAADTAGAVGQPLAYAFTVTNADGADPAAGATLTAPLPAGTQLLGVASTAGACAEAGRVVTCGLGTLAPGASAAITLTLRPDAAGPLAFTATAASATFEATWYDDAVAVETMVNPDTGAEPGGGLPTVYELRPNAPNPVAGAARIRFGLPQSGRTTLVVYDMLGREVARLVDAELPAGWHEATLRSDGLASGTYVYRLRSGDFAQARRMTVVH